MVTGSSHVRFGAQCEKAKLRTDSSILIVLLPSIGFIDAGGLSIAIDSASARKSVSVACQLESS
jgi:hypothetical protein